MRLPSGDQLKPVTPSFDVRDLLRLAAIEMQYVDLWPGLFVAGRRAARRQEGDRRTVRRPLRLRFAALAEGDLSRGSRAVGRNEPEVRAHLVLVAERRVALAGLALGCSHALTPYTMSEPLGEMAAPPTFLSAIMSSIVIGRLADCAAAACVIAVPASEASTKATAVVLRAREHRAVLLERCLCGALERATRYGRRY